MIKDNQYETYELVLKDEEDSVFALSLVSEPAIESNFVFFSADGKEIMKFATANEDKHLIVGPILIPEIKILRVHSDGKPYYVTFSKETVQKIAQKYIKDNNANNITLEHNKSVKNVSLVESWIVESSIYDKSKAYGLSVKPGTWMGVFSLENNKDLWNEYVKTGLVKGISLEGLFTHELIQASKVEFSADSILSDLEEQEALLILSEIRALIKKDNRYKGKKKVEMESFSDYGDGVANNAKKGRELNQANGNKCATAVGKVRSAQLEAKKPISIETVKRMYSYLSRAEVYYDNAESNSDCGYISFMLWGGKSALSWSRNKLRELGLLEEAEAQPSISSTYPGEQAKGKKKYKSKALLQEECPPETQDIAINLANRQNAIEVAHYGPLNPNEPNEEYWKAKAEQFHSGDIQSAKNALCGNCAFFDKTQKILDCIASGIGGDDAWDTINAGDISLCTAFDFKCAASRTCDSWLVGGPITD